ncbi:MAG: polyphosphate polymerase domain-containing protein [Bacteroidia bacterium]|nr:MAG: polyphosphate polymerase domain-containing protein [Bacteroidia bacterium]
MAPEILNILYSFNSVRLEEMDRVKLMDRYDTKYLLPANRIPDLLKLMLGRYRVLEINNERISSYTTVYLDTPDFTCFNQHVTERTGRLKVRFRTYNTTGNSFLEIKKKTKKGRTVKWRIENSPSENSFNATATEFIKTRVPNDPESLKPVLENNFKRITFTGFDTSERITLDLDISYASPDGKSAELPLVAILELKCRGLAARSPFSKLIKQFSIYPTGFSKYCIGCAMLHDLPLKNILKPKILLLNRIENEYNGSLSA